MAGEKIFIISASTLYLNITNPLGHNAHHVSHDKVKNCPSHRNFLPFPFSFPFAFPFSFPFPFP